MGVDEDSFVQHLNSLQINTGGVSFAWLLEEDNEILNWFYDNIGASNCLSEEENTIYANLGDSGNILEENILENELRDICKSYSGIPSLLHDDYSAALEDMRCKVENVDEWLRLIEQQEFATKSNLDQNEEICRELSKEKFDLSESICVEAAMLTQLTGECEKLLVVSRDERLKSYNVMNDLLQICAPSKNTEDKLFLSQLALDEFFSKTELLATYMKNNLSTQLNFVNRSDQPFGNNQSIFPSGKTDHNLKSAEMKLLEICDKLREAIWCYIKSKADLDGLLEQLKYIEKCDSALCFDACFEKVKYAGLVNLLEKEVQVMKEQTIPEDIQQYVDRQSEKLVLDQIQIQHNEVSITRSRHMYAKLCSLVNVSQDAIYDNGLTGMLLKRDQLSLDNLCKFSQDFVNCLQGFIQNTKSREMNPLPAPSPCFLIQTLMSLLQCPEKDLSQTCNASIEKCTSKLEKLTLDVDCLETQVFYAKFSCILESILESKHKCIPVREFIWDGPTQQPSVCNTTIDWTLYQVTQDNSLAEQDIRNVAKAFMEFKKVLERDTTINNLWKWFLADHTQIKLLKSKCQMAGRQI